jgi:methionine synthase I (cobalamin-dependent)/5,10-methylenetetrahydrofolate reductase
VGLEDRSLRHWLSDRVVVCDGATGTMLHAAGVPLERSLGELNLTEPELVRDLHAAYVAAGARIVQTNTFDANRLRLDRVGLADSVVEINIAGARLAREAARGSGWSVLVAGSVGPVISGLHNGRIARGRRASVLAEQIAALTNWVDLLMLETFGDLPAIIQAVKVAEAESDLPVIAQMTFSTDGRTLCGEDPATVASALAEFDVAAIGANCTVGPAALRDVVAELAAHSSLPITVQPNAGMPSRVGQQLRYAHNIEYFADEAVGFVASGATIVGGCCGTTPAHIRAVAEAVSGLEPPARFVSATARRVAPVMVTTAVEQADPRSPVAWPRAGEFAVIAGLHTPRGHDIAEFMEQAERLTAAGIDMLALTDPDPPAPRVNPIGAAVLVRERIGAEVILSVETADRTLAALQADLLGAQALGVDLVVCRTGTPRVAGDYPDPDSLWDVSSGRLVSALSGLNEGVDWRGVAVPERTRFVIGATVHTAAVDEGPALDDAEDKVRAGCHFLMTDTIYDIAGAERMLSRLRERVDVPVIAVVAPFEDATTLARYAHEVLDVALPSGVAAALHGCDADESLSHAVLTAEKLRHLASGVLVRVPLPVDVRMVDLAAALRALGGTP